MPIVPANDESIVKAAQALRRGALVAFPTETVYGLGADATDGRAVASIFEAKGRPRFNPLIVHVTDADAATRHATLSGAARELADAFWPGALTLVLDRRTGCNLSDLVSAGLDTVALRVPAHPVAQRLLALAGIPVAAPSANVSGHVSATTAAHVFADLRDAPAYILDAGPTPLGLESTVVDVRGDPPLLLRPGAIARADVERVIGAPLHAAADGDAPTSPGRLQSHYAPRAPLRLNATAVEGGEALLAFGPELISGAGLAINLSPTGDQREAAANLFGALRQLDEMRPSAIAVMAIPEQGLGEAINDRLRRAASRP